MSTVSRICFRCRIQLLKNRPALPSTPRITARTLAWSRLYPRDSTAPNLKAYSTKAKGADSPADSHSSSARRSKPDAGAHQKAEAVLEDPVAVRLEALARKLRPTKATPVDVDLFLASKRNKKVEAFTPTEADAQIVDESYGDLLSFMEAKKRPPRKNTSRFPPIEELQEKFDYPAATHVLPGLIDIPEDTPVVIHGFVKSVRKTGKSLVFMDVIQYTRGPIFSVQAISQISAASTDEQKALHDSLSKIPVFTPVAVTGRILLSHTSRPEIKLESLVRLNSVSKDIIFTDETVFPPEKRHLQLRTEKHLQNALRLRHKAAIIVRNNLNKADFMEVETPLLFKSTPEGAREFLVPTRSKENGGGMCYALPQSPQQYKQILMASGVSKYYQFAKCFRDEDLRADRQPEFTQIDLEMAFARQEDVILAIEKLIRELWTEVLGIELPLEFRRMTYQEAMMSYGSDKPDLRFKHLRIYVAQYGPMDREGWYKYRANTFYIRAPSAWPEEMRLKKIKALQEELIAENPRLVSYIASEETANGVPEHNLSAADVETINERMNILTGDLVLLTKAKHLTGGSTQMGRLRTSVIEKAVAAGLIEKPKTFEFAWIVDFPLFSPIDDSEPGQSGTAGLASTHHPFTAPNTDDFSMLATEPHKVRAEHYDLVVNGVELGGGSRRIHDPVLQRYILEDVLKVRASKLHQFDHLIDVLGSGCPPHAGIALGFDRLVAVMMGLESVRDVIAFPKNNKGADPLVGSPSLARDAELGTYHLKRELVPVPAAEEAEAAAAAEKKEE